MLMKKSHMAPAAYSIMLLLTILLVNGNSDVSESHCLEVPVSKFMSKVRTTLDVTRTIVATVSNFSSGGDFRLSNAVMDCHELMDFTADLLDAALAASQHPNYGKNNSTENVIADIKTWLSGALANQDTCKEGFDGTDGVLKDLVSGSLDEVSSLVRTLLAAVKPSKAAGGGGRKLLSGDREFPYWVSSHDRRLLKGSNAVAADAVVAADGTGDFDTIGKAVEAAPNKSNRRFVIHVKKGVYREYVEISKKKWNIMMIGDGAGVTVVTGNRSFVDGWTTFRSATFAVRGHGFIARDITFENTAGAAKHQAVAFRSDSDLSVLYRCVIRGFQDTLYAHSQRQFYRECQISGTIDFIFGDGSVVFQSCQIQARQGLPNQKNTITAQGRKDPTESSGFSIQFCNITAEANVAAPTYLGRPWKLYSRTVVMQSYIGGAVRPEGWLEWNGDFALNTLYYGEYMNYGPGSGLRGRVKWAGYHVLNGSDQASEFTVARFILGNAWLPSTGVKYTAGLTM